MTAHDDQPKAKIWTPRKIIAAIAASITPQPTATTEPTATQPPAPQRKPP